MFLGHKLSMSMHVSRVLLATGILAEKSEASLVVCLTGR